MGLRWRQTEVEVDLQWKHATMWESMEDPVMFQVFPLSNMCLKQHLYLTGFFLHMFWKLATAVTDFFENVHRFTAAHQHFHRDTHSFVELSLC